MEAYSFTAGADYGLYAGTLTGISGRSTDTSIDIVASNPAIVLEADDEGAMGTGSNIPGTELTTTETHYLMAGRCDPASLPGPFCPFNFFLREFSGSPIPAMNPNDEGVPPAPRSNGWRCRVIELTTAKDDTFVITVNGSDTIGVIVRVDLERGVPEWSLMAGIGEFTGSFIIIL